MNHADKLAAALQMFVSLAEMRRDELGALSPEMAECVAAGREALDVHADRTFADDCHELADRARRLRERGHHQNRFASHELHPLAELEYCAHSLGDNADCEPEHFQEMKE